MQGTARTTRTDRWAGGTSTWTVLFFALILSATVVPDGASFSATRIEGIYFYTTTAGDPGTLYRFDPAERSIEELHLSAAEGGKTPILGRIDSIDDDLYALDERSGRVVKVDVDRSQISTIIEEPVDDFCAGTFNLYYIRGRELYEYDHDWRQPHQLIVEREALKKLEYELPYMYLIVRRTQAEQARFSRFDVMDDHVDEMIPGHFRDFHHTGDLVYLRSGEEGRLERIRPNGLERETVIPEGAASSPRLGPEGRLYLRLHRGGLWWIEPDTGLRRRVAAGPVHDFEILGRYLFIELDREEQPLTILDLNKERRYIPEDFMRPGGLLTPEEAAFRLVPGLRYHVLEESRHYARPMEVRFRLLRYDGNAEEVTEVVDFMRVDHSSPYPYPKHTYVKGTSERSLSEAQLRRRKEAGVVSFEWLVERGAAVRRSEEKTLPGGGGLDDSSLIVLEPLGPQKLEEAAAPLERAEELLKILEDSALHYTLEREIAPEEGRFSFLLELAVDLPGGSGGKVERFHPNRWKVEFRRDPASGEILEFEYLRETRSLPDDHGLQQEQTKVILRKIETIEERMRREVQPELLRIFHLLYPEGRMSREFRLKNARVIYSMGEGAGMSVESFELQ